MKSNREKGSALLIVFVFAAIVAIMLYEEMPVSMFEAQRQKEQLLVDRGNEYAHAVKLFVRKVGRYPASLDELESTNNMRFLRHRFKDPMTGKDEWRLLHAGPGGILIDSKVKPVGGTLQGNSNTTAGGTPGFGSNGPSSGFGSSGPNSGFGSNGFGSNSSSSSSSSSAFASTNSAPAGAAPGNSDFQIAGSVSAETDTATAAQAIPQRPPAIAATGASKQATTKAATNDDPWTSLVPPLPSEQTGAANNQGGEPGAANPTNTAANGQTPAGPNNQAGVPNNQAGSGATGQGTTPGSAAMMQNMLNGPNGANVQGQPAAGAANGLLAGGGIAGVASKAEGRGIKMVNDQSRYSLWEFYYDPSQDQKGNALGTGAAPAGANTQGSSPRQNAFGANAAGQNSFGTNANGGPGGNTPVQPEAQTPDGAQAAPGNSEANPEPQSAAQPEPQ